MKQIEFKEYWKSMKMGEEEFFKSNSLTEKELKQIRLYIKTLQDKGATSKVIISHLQNFNKKIGLKWKAERVFWTETKKMNTEDIKDAGEELEIKSYRVILSPDACKVCLSKTSNGRRIYKNSDLQKAGYGHIPPFHPNCFCTLLPNE